MHSTGKLARLCRLCMKRPCKATSMHPATVKLSGYMGDTNNVWRCFGTAG